MRGYLLDTNVLSEVLKRRPVERVISRLRAVPAATLATSAVCVMELRSGAARHPTGSAPWGRVVATRNTRHLSRVKGLSVENWWD